MLQKRQISAGDRSVNKRKEAGLRTYISNKKKRCELDNFVSEVEEHEAHSAFEDSDQELEVLGAQVAATSDKPAVCEAPADFNDFDLDSELAAKVVSRNAAYKKSRKSLFGMSELCVNEVQPVQERAENEVSRETQDTVVLDTNAYLSPNKKPKVFSEEAAAALLRPEMPVLGSPTRMQRTQSSNSVNLQSPTATRRDSAITGEKEFTPVKDHVAHQKVADKNKGINIDSASGVIRTPSGRSYMFKPISKDQARLYGSILETVHEVAAGNLFRLYLGKNRAPRIGLCTSQLTSEDRVGVSSEMFESFLELKDTVMSRSSKPDFFEDVMVTSLFVGDTDPHSQNVGFNQNRELSKVDHGRAFLVSFKNGQDFLDYLVNLCKYHLYPYTLSISAIIDQLVTIKNKGLRKPLSIIDNAFSQLERSLTQYPKFPFKLGVYDQSRWVDPFVRAKLFAPTWLSVKPLDSWGEYKHYLSTMLQENYAVIDQAIAILQKAKAGSYDEIQYDLHATARQLCARKDFLVEIGVINRSETFPFKGTVFPYAEILFDEPKLLDYVDSLDAEKLQTIVDAINAKKESGKRMLNRDGLIEGMGLHVATKPPVVTRMVSEATVPNVNRQSSHAVGVRGLSDATVPQLYRYGTSHAGKLRVERAMPEEGEMKRD